jgi:heptosyltransferase-2
MKVALFLPNWLGDLAMATPTIRAVRRHFGPKAFLAGILRPYLADVLGGTDWLNEQWFFDPRSKDSELHSVGVARRMREQRFDMAILMPNSLRAAAVAWLGGAKERIGYVRYGRGPLLTGKLYPRRESDGTGSVFSRFWRPLAAAPMVDTYLELARVIGCGEESPKLELATVEADEHSADGVFKRLGLRGDGGIIALNSSGAYGGAKLWPTEYFGHLAQRIVDELDYDVLVTCGPKEREIAHEIVVLAGRPRVFSMADQPMDLGTAKAVIRRCRMMVSTDSGPRHVAAALGLPVVTMFGPMLPVWSENPTQQATNLILELDCIGCHQRTCPLVHHLCMRDLTVPMVFEAMTQLLEKTGGVASPSSPRAMG